MHGEVERESNAIPERIILNLRDENQSTKFQRYNFYRSLAFRARMVSDKRQLRRYDREPIYTHRVYAALL